MSERDKLTFAAEQLEWADSRAGLICIANRARELRALAAQQPEAVEPVAWMAAHDHKYLTAYKPLEDWWIPLYAHPQASAPADHTAADATVREEGSGLKTAASAVGVTTDLDALVAEAWLVKQSGTRDKLLSAAEFTQLSMDYGECVALVRKTDATKAITDLRAQLRKAGLREQELVIKYEAKLHTVKGQTARITRLEAENADARELLDEALDKFSRILDAKGPDGCSMSVLREFVNRANATIKQGATP